MILKAYSKGLYSNWFYYGPDRVLFDCGEGVTLFLKTGIFAIEKIFLSHGHIDHIAGLPNFICLRESTKGDNCKPLLIYYPAKDRSILLIKDFIDRMAGHFVDYPLEWVPVRPGDRIETRKGRVVEVFAAKHSGDDPLGFRIQENRKKLKSGLQSRPGRELAGIPNDEKYDYYRANLFCYSGDTMPLAPDLFRDADILIHDATFLDVTDRKAPLHASAQEAFDIARAANVKKLILCHISPRYETRGVIYRLLRRLNTHGVDYDWIPHHTLYKY